VAFSAGVCSVVEERDQERAREKVPANVVPIR
jgi:hypothetical protein